MDRVRKQIGASYAYEKGLTGAGIGVAVLDSGMDTTHPDLRNKLVYSYNYCNHTTNIQDDCGHGTHVCGIIGGTGAASGGTLHGVSPGCHFVLLKVLDEDGNGTSGSLIQALYWLIEHGKQYDVRIVNISVGGIEEKIREKSELVRAAEDAWKAGFVVCAAAGNQGPRPGTITSPGVSEHIITVGSSDDDHAVQIMGRKMIHYSGRGMSDSLIQKPDIVAPGYSVVSCNARWKQEKNKFYIAKSGTSMATPIVSGGIALLLSAHPSLKNEEIKKQLCRSCRNLGYPRNQQGCGFLDLNCLLKMSLGS